MEIIFYYSLDNRKRQRGSVIFDISTNWILIPSLIDNNKFEVLSVFISKESKAVNVLRPIECVLNDGTSNIC